MDSTEQAVTELDLQHEAVIVLHVLSLVQAARVLNDDGTTQCSQLQDVGRIEQRFDFVVGQPGITVCAVTSVR
jgi:hypothetical protein